MERDSRILSTISSAALTLLLGAAVAAVLLVNIREGAWCRKVGLFAQNWPSPRVRAHEKVDSLFLQQTPSGNVWLQFEGFQPGTSPDEGFMTHLYYRGNYTIYPWRIYVRNPSVVVNNGQAMVTSREFSDQSIPDAPDVRWHVKFSRSEQEEISVDVQRVP